MEADKAFSYPMFIDFRERNAAFSGVLARFPVALTMLSRAGRSGCAANWCREPLRCAGGAAGGRRLLSPADDETPGGHPVAVITHGFWLRRFGGDRSIVGKTVRLNGFPLTVVGVAPPGFNGTDVGAAPSFFVPLTMKAQMTPTYDGLRSAATCGCS